ncbi:hypothetical protein [Nocardia goodfellowii]|uniref:Integrase n=1 Tax=Nocardia goodfellowii TaxID=882446 RepID=A0ABS4QR30_9NOCA|nr:hypothetical protein [Nocardia goodfellowii]MBP2193583.1 hypothetical protein [Nocardia goodfellowii]
MNRSRPNSRSRWTERDEQVTVFAAEQWVLDFATVSLLCGTGRRRTYELIERWRDEFAVLRSVSIFLDNAEREVTVVWPRPAVAAERLGYPVSSWKPTSSNLAHKLAVAKVRAALCGLETGLWVPERKLLRDAAIAAGQRPGAPILADRADTVAATKQGIARGHVHDGRYRYRGQWLSVEVELTLKRPSRKRLADSVFNAYQRARQFGDGLLYLYGSKRIGDALERVVVDDLIKPGRIGAEPDIRLRSLTRVIEDRSIDLPTAPTRKEDRAR